MRTREQTLNHLLYQRFQKALTEYSMLTDGDRILIGLSGGKDSLCLLEMLARRQRIIKPRIEVEAIHVRMENIQYQSDTSYLEEFAEKHGVRLHILTTAFDDTKPTDKPACFARGTDARRCSALHKTTDSTRLPSATIWTTSYTRPCSTSSTRVPSPLCRL